MERREHIYRHDLPLIQLAQLQPVFARGKLPGLDISEWSDVGRDCSTKCWIESLGSRLDSSLFGPKLTGFLADESRDNRKFCRYECCSYRRRSANRASGPDPIAIGRDSGYDNAEAAHALNALSEARHSSPGTGSSMGRQTVGFARSTMKSTIALIAVIGLTVVAFGVAPVSAAPGHVRLVITSSMYTGVHPAQLRLYLRLWPDERRATSSAGETTTGARRILLAVTSSQVSAGGGTTSSRFHRLRRSAPEAMSSAGSAACRVLAPSGHFTQISTALGANYACGIKVGGVLECWGTIYSPLTLCPVRGSFR